MWPSLPPAKPVPRGPSPDGSDASPPPLGSSSRRGRSSGGEGGGRGGGRSRPPPSAKPLGPPPAAPRPPPREEVVARVPGGDEMLHPPSPLGIASGARARAGGRAGLRAPRSAGGGGGPAAGRGTAGERGGRCGAHLQDPGAPQGGREGGGRWTGEVFLLEVCVGRLVGDKTPCTPAWWRSGRPPTARRCAGPNPLPPFTVPQHRRRGPPTEGGTLDGEVSFWKFVWGPDEQQQVAAGVPGRVGPRRVKWTDRCQAERGRCNLLFLLRDSFRPVQGLDKR